jgi:hypothetical protein
LRKIIKIEISVELDKVRRAMKDRRIIVNETNLNKYLKLMAQGSFGANDDMYFDQTKDKETLLMYGFKLEKTGNELC